MRPTSGLVLCEQLVEQQLGFLEASLGQDQDH